MDPLSASVRGFREAFRTCAADPAARALCVAAPMESVGALQQVIRSEEWAPANRRPFVVTNERCDDAGTVYDALARVLREHYETLRADFRGDVPTLVPFGEAPGRASARDAFAAHLERFAACTAGALEPPCLVWFPAAVVSARLYEGVVGELLEATGRVRALLVVLDGEGGRWLGAPFAAGRDDVRSTTFAVDDVAVRTYYKSLLLTPPRKGRARGTLPGSAAPDVEPPPRPGPPPPTDDQVRAAMQEAGLPPTLTAGEAERLRGLVLGAGAAAGDRQADDAVRQQFAAYELCARAGLLLETGLMALVLAGYLVQAGRAAEAERWFAEAAAQAQRAGAQPQVAQAKIGLGYLHLQERRPGEAARQYEEAAAAALDGGSVMLWIEAQRMAGVSHLRAGQSAEAVRCWSAGVERGRAAPPGELRLTSCRTMAADLAELLRAGGDAAGAARAAAIAEELR